MANYVCSTWATKCHNYTIKGYLRTAPRVGVHYKEAWLAD